MNEVWTSVTNLLQTAGTVIAEVAGLLFHWSVAIFAVAWVAFAIDWRKMWPALRGGAAIPLVLIATMSAFVWGFLSPREATFLGNSVPNFAWQLIASALLLGLFLFCGWLQMRYSWSPPEIELEPANVHGHGHGHDDHHQTQHGDTSHGSGHGQLDAEDDGTPSTPPPVPASSAHSH